MVVFVCFEPILPPEMVVNIIKDEYMSTFFFYSFGVFHFWAFVEHFWAFPVVLGILGILGVSVEIWGILGVLVSYKITRGVRLILASITERV